MGKTIAQTVLKYLVDQASVKAAVAANSQIIGGTKDLVTAGQMLQRTFDTEAQSAKQLASTQQVLAQALHQDATKQAATNMQLLGTQTDTTATKVGVLAQQYRDVKAAQDAIRLNAIISSEPSDAALGIGRAGGNIGKSVTKAGRDLFNLPDVGGSTVASRLLVVGGAAIDKFNISTSALAVGVPIAGAAIIGLSIAADLVGDIAKASADKQKRYGEALQEVAEASVKGTRSSIDAQIEALEIENIVRKASIDLILEQTGASRELLDSLSRTELKDFGLAGITQNLLANFSGLAESATRVTENSRAIDANNFKMAALTDVIVEGTTAANDAREAEEKLAQQRLDFAQYFAGITKIETDEQLRQLKLRVEIDRMTAEQREEKLAQDRAELEIINTRLQQNNLYNNMTIEAEAILRERQGELVESILFTSEVTDTWADGVKRLADNIQHVTDQTDDYFEALKQEEDIRDKMTEIREKEAEIIEDRNVKVLELQADLYDKLATAQEGAGEKIRDIEEATAEKRQEIAENSAEKLFKLQRDAGRDLFDAVADRDALTHSKRSRQFADDLADQQTADQKQSDQLQKQRDKQTEAVSDTLEKQRKIAEKAFDKSTNDLYNTTVKQLNVQRRAYQEQEVALNNTLFNEQQIALYGSGNQRIIHTQMWTDLAGIAAIGVRNVVSAFSGAIGGVFNPSGHPTLSSTYPGGPSSQQVFNQNFDRRLNATINASSGVRGPI